MSPAGPQADKIYSLWWVFFWVCTIVYVLVIAVLLVPPFLHRRRAVHTDPMQDPPEPPDTTPQPAGERRRGIVVSASVAISIVILFFLLIGEFKTLAAFHDFSKQPDPVEIKLTGHQWWWEVRYENPAPNQVFTTANEIHVPVGRPVKLYLDSSDVIHSFWVPNLSGKKDLVPGHPNTTWFQADHEGEYQGQCAEFCGFQHAHMRLMVVAESSEKFAAWKQGQLQPAPEPITDVQQRGRDVFITTTCSMCHTIGGTTAGGRVGPPLTHVASRKTIAAGTLPNTTGHLAGWIVDPQRVKPGVRMPQHNNLPPADLRAVVEYLETLK